MALAWYEVAFIDHVATISAAWTFNRGAATPPFLVTQAVATTTLVANLNAAAVGSVSVTGVPTVGQGVVATSASAANWQSVIVNPLTTTGDTLYSNPGSTPVRLAIGAVNNLMTSTGTIPKWSSSNAWFDTVWGTTNNGAMVWRSGGTWSANTTIRGAPLVGSSAATSLPGWGNDIYDNHITLAYNGDITARLAFTLVDITTGTTRTARAPDNGGTLMLQPGLVTGDLCYTLTSKTFDRIAIGTPGQVLKAVGGVPAWADPFVLASSDVIAWNADTGLSRWIAGVVGVGLGTAGDNAGAIACRQHTVTKTATYSVTKYDTNTRFDNDGAGAQVVFNLPSSEVGLSFSFYVSAAQNVRVAGFGSDTIRIAGSVSTAFGHVDNATVGGYLTIECHVAGKWVSAGNPAGTWTVT